MIINDNIASEYGMFRSVPTAKPLPAKYKPTPVKDDYVVGYITRTAAVRRNDPTIGQEIDPASSGNIDGAMYQSYSFPWRISGKRDKTVVNGIIEDIGVAEANSKTVKKLGAAVERLFTNPLEFWRGY